MVHPIAAICTLTNVYQVIYNTLVVLYILYMFINKSNPCPQFHFIKINESVQLVTVCKRVDLDTILLSSTRLVKLFIALFTSVKIVVSIFFNCQFVSILAYLIKFILRVWNFIVSNNNTFIGVYFHTTYDE